MMTMFIDIIDIIDVHSTSWPAVKEIHLDVALVDPFRVTQSHFESLRGVLL